MKLKINKEYEQLVPRLDADNYATLKESIQKNGIRVKLQCLDDGTILCGHTRFQIAAELNINAVPYEIVKVEGRDNILLYIIEDNLHRRQLSTIQKCILGDKLEPIYARISKVRQIRKPISVTPESVGTESTHNTETTAQVAKAIGVGRDTREHYKRILKDNPDIIPRIEAGKTSINKEYKKITTDRKISNMPFRSVHIPMIQKGTKTQTSRGICRWQKGDEVEVVLFEPKQAVVVIEDIVRKRLGDFTEADAKREGGYTLAEFKQVWIKINHAWNENQVVNCILFKQVK